MSEYNKYVDPEYRKRVKNWIKGLREGDAEHEYKAGEYKYIHGSFATGGRAGFAPLITESEAESCSRSLH